jgi:hypothetical protein
MNAKPAFAELRPGHTVAFAALATVVALGILWGVATLFQSRGEPLERLAAAERACAQHAFQSGREACIQQWIAQSRGTHVANR